MGLGCRVEIPPPNALPHQLHWVFQELDDGTLGCTRDLGFRVFGFGECIRTDRIHGLPVLGLGSRVFGELKTGGFWWPMMNVCELSEAGGIMSWPKTQTCRQKFLDSTDFGGSRSTKSSSPLAH